MKGVEQRANQQEQFCTAVWPFTASDVHALQCFIVKAAKQMALLGSLKNSTAHTFFVGGRDPEFQMKHCGLAMIKCTQT